MRNLFAASTPKNTQSSPVSALSSGEGAADQSTSVPASQESQGFNLKKGHKSLLAEIGIQGCKNIEPLVVASLVTQVPLLLIGPHGTGKSFLLNRISEALDIEWRHYNASILNFDDLIGFPVPQEDGTLDYIKTRNSIWGANAVFFDEISRCRPDIQNKMFPIVHERRVQGIDLDTLRYRWGAMNPPVTDQDDNDYLGSEPLDIAFADRFAFVIDMPEWKDFSITEKREIVQMDSNLPIKSSVRLRAVIEQTTSLLPSYYETYSETVTNYLLEVSHLLAEVDVNLSPRRINMLFHSLLAVYASSKPLRLKTDLKDLTYLVLKNSLPMRCAGMEVRNTQLLTAHRQAWNFVHLPKHSSMRAIMQTQDLIARLKLALDVKDISKNERSTVVSDVFAQSSLGSRAAIAVYVFESGGIGSLNAAVAEEIGSVYQTMVQEINFSESVHPSSNEWVVWETIEKLISKLDSKKPHSLYFSNYLANLFVKQQIKRKGEVHKIYSDWRQSVRSFEGSAR